MNRLARRRDANLLPRGLDSSSQLHQFILSCCMLFTIHCGHRPPHIRREGPTINPVLFERDDPSDLVDVTVARRHSSEREREGAKIRKAKYLTQLFTKWSIFVCNCEAVTCYLFYNGRVAPGPDPTKKITHVPETFRAEQSRGAICFASPWITLLPNPNPGCSVRWERFRFLRPAVRCGAHDGDSSAHPVASGDDAHQSSTRIPLFEEINLRNFLRVVDWRIERSGSK